MGQKVETAVATVKKTEEKCKVGEAVNDKGVQILIIGTVTGQAKWRERNR